MSFFSSNAVSQRMFEKIPDMNGKEPKPGDLIEIFRGNYKHWVVYVGEGNVVHFGTDAGGSSGIVSHGKGAVVKEKLKDVVINDKWKINNYMDDRYKPRSQDDIVKAACNLVGTNLKYDLLNYNCEHFATEMRYDKPKSRQAKAGKAGIIEGIAEAAIAAGVAVGAGVAGLVSILKS